MRRRRAGEAEVAAALPRIRHRADEHAEPGRVHVPDAAEVRDGADGRVERAEGLDRGPTVGPAEGVAVEREHGHAGCRCLGEGHGGGVGRGTVGDGR